MNGCSNLMYFKCVQMEGRKDLGSAGFLREEKVEND
jgi:hypothetical protein